MTDYKETKPLANMQKKSEKSNLEFTNYSKEIIIEKREQINMDEILEHLVCSKYLNEENYQDDIEILSFIMYKTPIIEFETKFMEEFFCLAQEIFQILSYEAKMYVKELVCSLLLQIDRKSREFFIEESSSLFSELSLTEST